jgi:hypothetical protein
MGGIVARLLILAVAAVFAVAAWVGAAALRPEFAFLAAAALAAFLGSGYAMLRAVDAREGRSDRWNRRAWLGCGAVAFAAVAHIAVGRQPAHGSEEPDPPGGLAHWTMPDGARLAYLHVPAAGTARSTPVIMLHGGPGMPLLPALADRARRSRCSSARRRDWSSGGLRPRRAGVRHTR